MKNIYNSLGNDIFYQRRIKGIHYKYIFKSKKKTEVEDIVVKDALKTFPQYLSLVEESQAPKEKFVNPEKIREEAKSETPVIETPVQEEQKQAEKQEEKAEITSESVAQSETPVTIGYNQLPKTDEKSGRGRKPKA